MPEKLLQIEQAPPRGDWTDATVPFRKGFFCYGGTPKSVSALGLPNPRKWQPFDPDWQLPSGWKVQSSPA